MRPVKDRQRLHCLQYKYGFQTTEKLAFGFIKLSILFLWRRVFGHVRSFNMASWAMIGIVTAWSLTFFFATIFQCGLHWSRNWAPIEIFLTQCSNTLDMLSVFTTTDIVTDLLIIAMPIPMVGKVFKNRETRPDIYQIWSLQLSTHRKLAISAMFLVGFLYVFESISDEI